MNIEEIVTILEKEEKLTVERIEYKTEEDKAKYGLSLEAKPVAEYIEVKVNGLVFRTSRIIEEYGRILFIYNYNQIEAKPNDIETLEIL